MELAGFGSVSLFFTFYRSVNGEDSWQINLLWKYLFGAALLLLVKYHKSTGLSLGDICNSVYSNTFNQTQCKRTENNTAITAASLSLTKCFILFQSACWQLSCVNLSWGHHVSWRVSHSSHFSSVKFIVSLGCGHLLQLTDDDVQKTLGLNVFPVAIYLLRL